MLREEDIFKLRAILINTLELEESDNVDEITKLNCVKWDSLAQAIIIAAVADEFSIDVSGNEFAATQSVYTNDIIRWVIIGITFGLILFLISGIRKKMNIETELSISSNFQGNTELPSGSNYATLPSNISSGLSLEPAFDEDGNPIEPVTISENLNKEPAVTKAVYDKV